MRTSVASRPTQCRLRARTCADGVAHHATAHTVAWTVTFLWRDRVVNRVKATRLPKRSREKSAEGVLRPGESLLCIPVYSTIRGSARCTPPELTSPP